MFFLVLVYVFNFDLFEFSVAILEKGLLAANKQGMITGFSTSAFLGDRSIPKILTRKAYKALFYMYISSVECTICAISDERLMLGT